MHFLIQTIGGQIVDDFAFELIQCQEYYRWKIPVEPFEITYHEGLSFDGIANPDKYIPVGSVEFVSLYLDTFYPEAVAALRPLNVPEVLFPLAGRRIVNVETTKDLQVFKPGAQLFRKSNHVIKNVNNGLWVNNPERQEEAVGFQVSEEINIDSEWRLFVFHDEILHVSNYAGDPLLFPSLLSIRQMLSAYKGLSPAAYTLDVGVCLDHEKHQVRTVVIECHRFFSCGLYGFGDRNKYPKMLSQTWFQMKHLRNG